MAISINKVSKEIQNQVIEDYKNGKSMRQIEKDYNVTRQTVAKFLEKNNIKNTSGNHYRLYNHNENYFETIDNEHKAYWLGYMFADGHITNNENHYGQDSFGLSCAKEDKNMLFLFLQDLEANNPVHEYARKDNYGQPLCRIQITSQKTVDDLISKGCIKQKSLILKPPKDIPKHLIRHFIRGFFDGDGSITKSWNKKQEKFIYGINITSTYDMCEWIADLFNGGSIIKEKRRENTYYFSTGGSNQIKRFYHWLYDDATLYLERKYIRFLECIKYQETKGINV